MPLSRCTRRIANRNPQRLVRFLAKDGRTYYGDAILPRGSADIGKAKQAHVIKGDIFGKHEVTDEVADIRMFLAPLAPEDVRTVRCLGTNYAKHAHEVGMPLPKYPILFVRRRRPLLTHVAKTPPVLVSDLTVSQVQTSHLAGWTL